MADIQIALGIVTNPQRQGGRPTIQGTRITVELVLDQLAAGHSIEDILTDYPHLTREQVLHAIAYAAQLVHAQASKASSGDILTEVAD